MALSKLGIDIVRPRSFAAAPPIGRGVTDSTTPHTALVRGPAAIHRQGRACDRCSSLARQEDGKRAKLFDRRKTLVRLLCQQDVADDLFARNAVRLGLALNLGLNKRRIDIAWAYGIASDALLGGLERGDFGETDNAVLRCDVGRLERRCDQTMRRRDIDDAAPLVLEHRRER